MKAQTIADLREFLYQESKVKPLKPSLSGVEEPIADIRLAHIKSKEDLELEKKAAEYWAKRHSSRPARRWR
jgi:hypothetical protein